MCSNITGFGCFSTQGHDDRSMGAPWLCHSFVVQHSESRNRAVSNARPWRLTVWMLRTVECFQGSHRHMRRSGSHLPGRRRGGETSSAIMNIFVQPKWIFCFSFLMTRMCCPAAHPAMVLRVTPERHPTISFPLLSLSLFFVPSRSLDR